MPDLSPKLKRLADEYLIDLNATQAAIRAGYSPKTAYSIGCEYIKKPEVKKYLAERQAELEEKTHITQEWVLMELAKIAGANITDFASVQNEHVFVKDTDDIPLEKLGALAGVKQGRYGIEVQQYDRLKALELIGRHIGMFKDKMELSGAVNTNSEKLDNLVDQLWGGDSGE